jgi:hypothetical protein
VSVVSQVDQHVEPRTVPPDEPSPHHGFQGHRGRTAQPPELPSGFTVAVSREAGARGGSIGRRVGRKLGWQVYDQELLEHVAAEATIRQDVFDALPPGATAWVEERLRHALDEHRIPDTPTFVNLARVVLALGAQGEVVLIGRGAGWLLPRETTLHTRVVAPVADRIAYMGQWLRLTAEEAAERVRVRDSRRADYLAGHLHAQPADVYQYDLVLNSSHLGEELCADLIVHAIKARVAARVELRG